MRNFAIMRRLVTSMMIWAVVLGFAVQFVLSPTVSATTIYAGWGEGETTCDMLTCDADTEVLIADSWLDVDDGDTVHFHMNYSYNDDRPSPAPDAKHRFHIEAWYKSVRYYNFAEETTNGLETGGGSFYVEVPNVDEDTTITVEWNSHIIVISPFCFDSDTEGPFRLEFG